MVTLATFKFLSDVLNKAASSSTLKRKSKERPRLDEIGRTIPSVTKDGSAIQIAYQ